MEKTWNKDGAAAAAAATHEESTTTVACKNVAASLNPLSISQQNRNPVINSNPVTGARGRSNHATNLQLSSESFLGRFEMYLKTKSVDQTSKRAAKLRFKSDCACGGMPVDREGVNCRSQKRLRQITSHFVAAIESEQIVTQHPAECIQKSR